MIRGLPNARLLLIFLTVFVLFITLIFVTDFSVVLDHIGKIFKYSSPTTNDQNTPLIQSSPVALLDEVPGEHPSYTSEQDDNVMQISQVPDVLSLTKISDSPLANDPTAQKDADEGNEEGQAAVETPVPPVNQADVEETTEPEDVSGLHDVDVMNTEQLKNESCLQPTDLPPLLPPPDDMPKGLKDYIKFHRKYRHCVDDFSSCKEAPKIIVWESERGWSGGYGDRILAIRNLLMLSILTRRVFVMHWQAPWSTPFSLLSALQPTYINWTLTNQRRAEIFNDEEHETFTYYVKWHPLGGLRNPLDGADDVPLQPDKADFEALFSNYTTIRVVQSAAPRLVAYLLSRNMNVPKRVAGLSNLSFVQLERHLSDFLFRPSAAVSFLVRRRTFGEGLPYVAAHVRTGVDVAEGEDERFKGFAKQYATISNRFLTCAQRADKDHFRRVFLASDSLGFKKQFLKDAERFGYEANTNKRFAWHVDREPTDLFTSQRDNCIAFLDVFADSYALARAKTVMYLVSNFPEVSIGMGKATTEGWLRLDRHKELTEDDCYPASFLTDWETVL